MNVMSNIPAEIVRVRREHQTLYMRIPSFWAKRNGVLAGSYVVARPGPDGSVILRTFESEVKNGKIAGNSKCKGH